MNQILLNVIILWVLFGVLNFIKAKIILRKEKSKFALSVIIKANLIVLFLAILFGPLVLFNKNRES